MGKTLLLVACMAVSGGAVWYGSGARSVVTIGPAAVKAIQECNRSGLDSLLDTRSGLVKCAGAVK